MSSQTSDDDGRKEQLTFRVTGRFSERLARGADREGFESRSEAIREFLRRELLRSEISQRDPEAVEEVETHE